MSALICPVSSIAGSVSWLMEVMIGEEQKSGDGLGGWGEALECLTWVGEVGDS